MIMKKMRKVAGMLMAATVAMAMPMSAMAANITVEKAVKGAIYSAYRVFDYTKDDNGGYLILFLIPVHGIILLRAVPNLL